MTMSKPAEDEMATLLHVTMTSDVIWAPATLYEDWHVNNMEVNYSGDDATSLHPVLSTEGNDLSTSDAS